MRFKRWLAKKTIMQQGCHTSIFSQSLIILYCWEKFQKRDLISEERRLCFQNESIISKSLQTQQGYHKTIIYIKIANNSNNKLIRVRRPSQEIVQNNLWEVCFFNWFVVVSSKCSAVCPPSCFAYLLQRKSQWICTWCGRCSGGMGFQDAGVNACNF